MVQRTRFCLFDSTGQPLEEATPEIVVFRKADGTEAFPYPAIEEKGDGFYEFSVDPELNGPVAYIIYCGPDSSVTYQSGAVGELIAFTMYDSGGVPDDTATPTFSVFTDGDTELPFPEITNLTGGLFGFWPTPEPEKIIQYIVGDLSNTYFGTVGSVQLLPVTPPAESEIIDTQTLTLDVVDTECFLGRVIIAVEYVDLNGTELAWDGEAVCGPFQVTTTPITNGIRYNILRLGGWPASPKLRVFLTNLGGREL